MDKDHLPEGTPVSDDAPDGAPDEFETDDERLDDEGDDDAALDDEGDDDELPPGDDGFEDEGDDDEFAGDEPDDEDESADETDDETEGQDEVEDETDFATVAAGTTVEEARRTAVEQLRKIVPSVAEADVEFIVLDEGSRGGFFGRGKSQARVEARVRPAAPAAAEDDDGEQAAERLRAFLERTLDLMGIAAAVEVTTTAEGVRADVSGDDLGLLIGRHGSTIDALQYVAAIVVNGDRRQRRQVVVDAEGYRVRRESILRTLAERTAQRVARDHSAVALKPMSAAERKVIHLYLKDHPRVETASEGNEPFRAVVVSPRRRF